MEPETSETREMFENQSLAYGLIGASTILLTIGLTVVIVKHVQYKREMNVIFFYLIITLTCLVFQMQFLSRYLVFSNFYFNSLSNFSDSI